MKLTALGEDVDRIVGLEIGWPTIMSPSRSIRASLSPASARCRGARALLAVKTGPRLGPLRFEPAGAYFLPNDALLSLLKGRKSHDDKRGVRPAARLSVIIPEKCYRASNCWNGLTVGSPARLCRAQRRRSRQPNPPKDRTWTLAIRRSSRPCGLADTSSLPKWGAVMCVVRRLIPGTIAGQITGLVIIAVLLGVGLASAVLLYLIDRGLVT